MAPLAPPLPTPLMQRKQVSDHISRVCYLRPYQCEFCGLKDTFRAITGCGEVFIPIRTTDDNKYFGHHAICPEAPLTCPNKCGSRDIKRKDMDNHRSKCPREIAECPFAEAGCDSAVLRCQLKDHMTSNIQQHLMMVMKDNRETKVRLKETQLTVSATQHEMNEANVKLGETQAKLSEMQAELGETQAKLCETQIKLCETQIKLSVTQATLDEVVASVNAAQFKILKLQANEWS